MPIRGWLPCAPAGLLELDGEPRDWADLAVGAAAFTALVPRCRVAAEHGVTAKLARTAPAVTLVEINQHFSRIIALASR